jgi:hypothetical protein
LEQKNPGWYLTQAKTQTIDDGNQGSIINSYDGEISITVPGGAVKSGTVFTLKPIPSPKYAIGKYLSAGISFMLTAVDGDGPVSMFDPPLNLVIQYDPKELGDITESLLLLYNWDPIKETWQDSACSPYDRSGYNQFSVDICHLSEFSVLGVQEPPTDSHSGLILNGSFEESPSLVEWEHGGSLNVSRDEHAIHGAYSLQLGDEVSHTEQGLGDAWAHQTFYVRPDWDQPTLYFKYNMFANDTIGYSTFRAFLFDQDGMNQLEEILEDGLPTDNYDPSRVGYDMGWRTATFDLSAYQGQFIRLMFLNHNEHQTSKGLWTFVDDVRVIEAVDIPPENAIFLPLVKK